MLLWALLLTLTAQGAGAGEPPELQAQGLTVAPGRAVGQHAEAQQRPRLCTPGWDEPVCTEGVSVTRGAPTEITCNSCNPIRKVNVSICLRAPGRKNCWPIFTQATPGCSSRDGWRLCVQGHSAKMVTEEAWDSQAGRYRWILMGRQREERFTILNVSEPPELPSTPPWGTQDPLPAQDLRSAQDPPPGRLHVALILAPMLLCILALGGLQFWRRNHGRPLHVQLP